jgi:N-acetylglucosamine-6-phosphate deacetylase
VVENRRARLAGTTRLAGSTLTTDAALRRGVEALGLSIEQASEAASGVPARVLGLDTRAGSIAPGLAADFVVLDDALQVRRVMVRGAWHQSARPAA